MDVRVATLALTGTLLLLLRTAYTLMRYSIPGSSSETVADVRSPGTRKSNCRPPGEVGMYVTKYSVTSISFFHVRFTFSVVTSVTVRSSGGETGKDIKAHLRHRCWETEWPLVPSGWKIVHVPIVVTRIHPIKLWRGFNKATQSK